MNELVRIRRATDEPAVVQALADVLLDCVEGGASVSFMHPLPRAKAIGFWQGVLASAARGEPIVLVAEDAGSGAILGTVQVVPATPENQPHRADVAKTLCTGARAAGAWVPPWCGEPRLRRGKPARRCWCSTRSPVETPNGSLYARLGWQRCGEIPGYALWPRGGLCSTTVFYRVLG